MIAYHVLSWWAKLSGEWSVMSDLGSKRVGDLLTTDRSPFTTDHSAFCRKFDP
jgi:hypothetical protein